jgi:TRAP-type mannitol/chloroaromatic compound transport system permease small subunit
MNALLGVCRAIDALSQGAARIAMALVLLCALVSAANALSRYGFDLSSNAWLELQWYMFAVIVMFGASYTLQRNEHVRVDVFYGQLSARIKVMVDLFGLTVFLLPVMGLMIYLSFPLFLQMFNSGEMSSNAGGLIRWPAMLMLPLGFSMVFLQGLSEIIKRVGWLSGQYEMSLVYERPLQ